MAMEIKKVGKVWGHEEWIVNKDYCGKKLVLKKGFRCSVHYHKQKDETLYLIKGKVLLELGKSKKILNLGDAVNIPKGARHRFMCLEALGIIEFSKNHEAGDSYREETSGEVDLSTSDIP